MLFQKAQPEPRGSVSLLKDSQDHSCQCLFLSTGPQMTGSAHASSGQWPSCGHSSGLTSLKSHQLPDGAPLSGVGLGGPWWFLQCSGSTPASAL